MKTRRLYQTHNVCTTLLVMLQKQGKGGPMLVNGKWEGNWQTYGSIDNQGNFVRQASTFRNWVTPDGSPGPAGWRFSRRAQSSSLYGSQPFSSSLRPNST